MTPPGFHHKFGCQISQLVFFPICSPFPQDQRDGVIPEGRRQKGRNAVLNAETISKEDDRIRKEVGGQVLQEGKATNECCQKCQ